MEDYQVLSRFWYPFAFSDEVVDQPVHRMILDETLIGYRTSGGNVVVAKDLCIHRGAPLSLGWQDGDELVCAYHGFRFGPSGRCTRVPAQPDLPIPAKLCLQTVRSVERYGIVWICFDDQPRGALPEWPEAERADYRRLHLEPQEWPASAARQLENFIDVAHFSWVHAGTFGNPDRPDVMPYEVERTGEYSLRARVPYLASNPEGSTMDGGQPGEVQRHMNYDLSALFSCRLVIDYGGGRRHCVFDSAVPVSRTQVRIFFFIARNFDHHVPAEELLDWERKILSEDRPIVVSQRPEELPLDLSEEFHIGCDRFSTAYRNLLREIGLGAEMSK